MNGHKALKIQIKAATLRQRKRRRREQEWLKTHGYTSWESLHTALMVGKVKVIEAQEEKESPVV